MELPKDDVHKISYAEKKGQCQKINPDREGIVVAGVEDVDYYKLTDVVDNLSEKQRKAWDVYMMSEQLEGTLEYNICLWDCDQDPKCAAFD